MGARGRGSPTDVDTIRTSEPDPSIEIRRVSTGLRWSVWSSGLALVFFLLPSCAPGDPGEGGEGLEAGSASQVRGAEELQIGVTRLRPGRWQVTYTLDDPANRLRFTRNRHAFRHEGWEIRTPGVKWKVGEEGEALVSTDGTAFEEIVLRFSGDPRKREAEYVLSPHFTDGSEALFTGLLYAGPVRGGKPSKAVPVLELRAEGGEAILLEGRRRPSGFRWRDTAGEGTYVYFGDLAPVETERMVAVLDPGLPEHLADLFATHLPRLFDRFESTLGHGLKHRPTVLVAYDPGDLSPEGEVDEDLERSLALWSHGDVVAGVLRFELSGPDWALERAQVRRSAFHLLAHEAVHLWNGWRFQSREGGRASWLHEGSAEALAWLAALEFGIRDEENVHRALEEALNRCLFAATDRTVVELMDSGVGPYACGAAIHAMVEYELGEKGGLVGVWRAVFERSEEEEGVYDTDLFLATLEELAGDRRLASFLRSFLEGESVQRAAEVRAELTRLGLDATPGRPRDEVAWPLLQELLVELMRNDCEGAYSVSREATSFVLRGRPTCRTLPAGEVRVVFVEEQPLEESPGRALGAATEACRDRGRLELGLEGWDQALALECVRELPPYLRLG